MKKTKDFSFKQFVVHGGYSGMPVSTDGVLLGAWANVEPAQHLLDIGTGTGLLSLMCAQRNTQLSITAIDIDTSAIEAAQYNFEHSPWQDRLELIEADVLTHTFPTLFDVIVCNPPYFNNGEQAQLPQRATARHTDTLSHNDLLTRCYSLLSEDGCACFILPTVEGEAFIKLALQSNWYLNSRVDVFPTDTKKSSRLLIQIGKKPQSSKSTTLTIRVNGQYSDDFVDLTKEFYLKM